MPAEPELDIGGCELAELMMMLSEVTPVPDAALPLEAFKAHLRLGTGFGESDLQDSVLIGFLRAALAAIEKRTSKALLQRGFLWQVTFRGEGKEHIQLPLAPVNAITAITRIVASGAAEILDPTDYVLEPDSQFPRLSPKSGCLPHLPSGARLDLEFSAGYGATWQELPADLAQAVLMLAAHFYEFRNDTGLHGGCMPFGVSSLIERYRALRLTARAVS